MGELPPIIKLDATDSTNLYLKRLLRFKELEDFTTIVTKNQVKGRGQRGTTWHSEAGKNLTFSVLKNFKSLPAAHQFNLNICVSLALYDVLNALNIPRITVKWPNDIMSGISKICGVLIENTVKEGSIKQSVIGIGLNVNQTAFAHLNRVASLRLLTGQDFDLEELLYKILKRLRFHLSEMEEKTVEQLLPSYEQLLFRKDIASTFKNVEGQIFMGIIRGVSATGKLVLEPENGIVKEFGLKEVSLLY